MSSIYVPIETTANVIRVDGLCYERVGESTNEVTPDISIEGTYTDCEDCSAEPAPASCPCEEPLPESYPCGGLNEFYNISFTLTVYSGGGCSGGPISGTPTVVNKTVGYYGNCHWTIDGDPIYLQLYEGRWMIEYFPYDFGIYDGIGDSRKTTGNTPAGNYPDVSCFPEHPMDNTAIMTNIVVSKV